MTREEAIKLLTQYIDYDAETPDYYKMEEACKVAIKALSAEPCDCISRAELLKAVDTWDRFGCDAGSSKLVPIKDCYVPYIHYDDVVKAIKGMPSIQPKTDVLDKIRAEIEFIPTIEWKDDGTTYILASYFKKQVLEIIDKYKAEKE